MSEAATWICAECGEKHGSLRPGIETYHQGTCDFCGTVGITVCHVRRYGWPKINLEVKP